ASFVASELSAVSVPPPATRAVAAPKSSFAGAAACTAPPPASPASTTAAPTERTRHRPFFMAATLDTASNTALIRVPCDIRLPSVGRLLPGHATAARHDRPRGGPPASPGLSRPLRIAPGLRAVGGDAEWRRQGGPVVRLRTGLRLCETVGEAREFCSGVRTDFGARQRQGQRVGVEVTSRTVRLAVVLMREPSRGGRHLRPTSPFQPGDVEVAVATGHHDGTGT